jgi:CheY-like chemotaxis protein
VDRSRERSQGGLGIGLSLVQRLIEAHGGSVQAHSEGLGKGSEFVVRLPVFVEESAHLNPGATPGAPSVTARILVVDDNRDSAESLTMFLRLVGNDVHSAYDGLEGVEAAERLKPDVVLLDIGMPGLNGIDACRRIRSQPWGANILVIALTGWAQEEDRRLTAAAGFDAHLVKPIDPADVMKLIAARAE